MNKVIIPIICFFISSSVFALKPYQGSYDLYADTKMGNLNIGTAVLTLKIDSNQFEFNTLMTDFISSSEISTLLNSKVKL